MEPSARSLCLGWDYCGLSFGLTAADLCLDWLWTSAGSMSGNVLRCTMNNQLRTGSGQGESDCLIKTKHCDGQKVMLTQCDFCPVL